MASMFKLMTPDQLAGLDNDTVLLAWQEAALEAAVAKKREAELRILAFNKLVGNPAEGTTNIPLGNGWLLKAEMPFNYTVANTDDMDKALDKLPEELSARLVKFKPELSIKEFKLLSEEQHKIIDPFITVKPGLPTLKLLEPGAEGNKRPKV